MKHIWSVLAFRVVMMVGTCFLRFLLPGSQHIIERVVADALPATQTEKSEEMHLNCRSWGAHSSSY
jgi:hypothetical protein